jgi:hypothetical protein
MMRFPIFDPGEIGGRGWSGDRKHEISSWSYDMNLARHRTEDRTTTVEESEGAVYIIQSYDPAHPFTIMDIEPDELSAVIVGLTAALLRHRARERVLRVDGVEVGVVGWN